MAALFRAGGPRCPVRSLVCVTHASRWQRPCAPAPAAPVLARRWLSEPRRKGNGEDSGLRGFQSLGDIYDFYQVYAKQMEDDVVARDIGVVKSVLLFMKFVNFEALRRLDWKDFRFGARQAYDTVNSIIQSRDFAVHAMRHLDKDGTYKGLTADILGEAPVSDATFKSLQGMVSARVFDFMTRAILHGVVVQRTYFELEKLDIKRCALWDATCYQFVNRLEREMFLAAFRWAEPKEYEQGDELAAEMKRVDEETWAKIDIKFAVVETMRTTTIGEDGEREERLNDREFEATFSFLGCLKGPEPLEWVVVDIK